MDARSSRITKGQPAAMIPRMTALIALLAVLLSGPAFGAESLGGVPQTENAEVVDAGADKQVLDLPSQSAFTPLARDPKTMRTDKKHCSRQESHPLIG